MRRLILFFGISALLLTTSCATRVAIRPNSNVKVIKVLPENHKVVVVKGNRYYFWNGKHYRKTGRGYVLVKI